MSSESVFNIEGMKLHIIYFYEIWSLANSIKRKSESLFSAALIPDDGYIFQSDPEIHSLIDSIISDAASIKKYVSVPERPAKNEGRRQFELRKARSKILKDLIECAEVSEILNSKVRNTLQHFDEYLDESNINLIDSKDPDIGLAAYNLVISSFDAIDTKLYPIKLYVSSERKFYNMKYEIDLGKISSEANDILAVIKESGVLFEVTGGLLIRLD